MPRARLLAHTLAGRGLAVPVAGDQATLQPSAQHTGLVSAVAFSPDGALLASGDTNGLVYVWSARDGRLVRRYEGGGDIYDVEWSPGGDRIAVCSSDHTIAVMDLRK